MNTVAIVQARMTSTRLPGKVLMEVEGRPLLAYQLERLSRIKSLGSVVVATTTNVQDEPVVELCERMKVPTYRGCEHDVLSRYYEAAAFYKADNVVRFTADCPLIDPEISERVISKFLSGKKWDYCSVNIHSYPRGTDTEIFTMSALREAYSEGTSDEEREHVTYFIWTRPERYRIFSLTSPRDLSRYRITVDTPEDFARVKAVISHFGRDNVPGLESIVAFLDRYRALLGDG